MKRKNVIIMAALLVMALLTGCSSSIESLTDNYDKEALDTAVLGIIADFQEENYGAIASRVAKEYEDELSEEVLKSAWESVGKKLGAPVEVTNTQYYSQDGSGVIVIDQVYEDGKLTFTMAFNPDYEVIGLWMK